MQEKTMLFLGGDLRQSYLANQFAKGNDNILILGLDNRTKMNDRITELKRDDLSKEILNQVDLVVLPMPAMENELYFNAPFAKNKLVAEEILSLLPRHTCVLGGKIIPALERVLTDCQLNWVDYLEREELAVRNAIPTAEGALQIMMQELPVTIFGLPILMIGAGRISRVLRRMLTALGATVTVSARKHSDLAWIESDGCHSILSSQISEEIGKFPMIINTVPAKILTESVLKEISPEALVLDLASKPGGVDFDEANRLGVKTIWALSLPGKVAPLSAGEIIYRTLCNILDEFEL